MPVLRAEIFSSVLRLIALIVCAGFAGFADSLFSQLLAVEVHLRNGQRESGNTWQYDSAQQQLCCMLTLNRLLRNTICQRCSGGVMAPCGWKKTR